MSKTIDQKVVEMKFDNSKFEKNVKQSMSSIDKLKQALNFSKTSKDLDNLNNSVNKVDFSKLESTAVSAGFHIRDVWEKISTVFEYQIAGRIIRASEDMIRSLSTDQITAGWNKYEQKTQNVQTLMNSTGKSLEEVNEYLAELMWYSDETSFGFTDMTSALATMTSSGGDIEKLIPMIEGMGNATAYAGKGAAEFSRVIYNLNQSYSQGFLSTMDWRSVQNAGAASKQLQEYLIQAAEQVGTIRKGMYSIQDFPTLLSKKLITSDAMEIAFTRFAEYTRAIKQAVDDGTYETATEAMQAMGTEGFDEVAIKAFQAAQNAKSFSEAIDATKDAVSSGWQRIFEVLFGDLNQATELWTAFCGDLWEIFASSFDGRVDWLKSFMSNSPFDVIKNEIEDLGISWEEFEDSVKEVANSSIPQDLRRVIESAGSVEEALVTGRFSPEQINRIFTNLIDNAKESSDELGTIVEKTIDYTDVVNRVIRGGSQGFGTGAERKKNLEAAGWDPAKVQEKVNKVLAGEKVEMIEVNEVVSENVGLTKEQIIGLKNLRDELADTEDGYGALLSMMSGKTGRDLAIETLANALHGLMAVLDTIKEAWSNVFPRKTATQMYTILYKISKLSQKLLPNERQADKLRRTFEGLFSVVGIGVDAFKVFLDVIKQIFDAIPKGNKTILDVTAAWGDWVKNLRETIKENQTFQKVGNVVVSVAKGIIKVVQTIIDKAKELWGVIKENQYVKDFIDWLSTTFHSVINQIKEDLGVTETGVSGLFEVLDNFIKNLKFDGVTKGIDKIGGFFDKFNQSADLASGGLAGFKLKLKNTKNDLIAAFSAGSITDFKDSILGMFGGKGNLLDGAGTSLKNAGEGLKSFFDNIDTGKMKNFAIVFASIFSAFSLSTGIDKIYKVVANIGGVGAKIKETLTVVQRGIKTFQKAIRAKSIMYIAMAIGILAASLAALSYVPQDQLREASKSLSMVAGAISVLILVMGIAGKMGKFGVSVMKSMAGTLMAFGLSILAISGSLILLTKFLEDKSFLDIGKAFVVLSAIIAEMVVVAALLSRRKQQFATSGVGLLMFSLSVWAIIKVLKNVGKDAEVIKNNIGSLVYILGAMFAISLVLRKAGGGGAKPVAAAFGLLLFSLSLLSVFATLKLICFLGLDDIKKNLGAIAGIIISLLGISFVISKAGPDALKAGAGIFAITAGMFILVLAMEEIGKEENKTKLLKGLGVIALLTVFVDSMLWFLKSAQNVEAKTILNIIILLGTIVAGLFILTKFGDPDDLLKASQAIGRVILSLGLILVAFGALNKLASHNDKGKITNIFGPLLSMLAILVVVSAAMLALTHLIPSGKTLDSLVPFASAMAIVILALGGVIAVLGFVSKFINSTKILAASGALVIASASLIPIAYALTLLAPYSESLNQMIPMLWTMAGVVAVLAGVCALLGVIGPTAIVGALALDGILLVIGAMAVLVGSIVDLCEKHGVDIVGYFDKAITIAEKIGEFVGALAGGFLKGVSGGIESLIASLGSGLGDFGSKIGPFIDSMKKVDGTFLAGISMFSLGILELTAAELIAGIATIGGVGLVGFALTLNKFSSLLSSGFLKDMGDLDPNSVSATKTLAEALLILTAADLLNGITQFVTGKSSMEKFAEGLEPLGEGIVKFAKVVKDVDISGVDAAINAAKILSELEAGLPKHDGLLQKWLGDADLETFGQSLETFATSIVRFCTIIKLAGDTIDSKMVENVATTAKIMSTFEENLPKHDGIVQEWFGDATLESFGNNLVTFGECIVKFCNVISTDTLNEEKVQKVRNIADIMVELEKNLEPQKGVVQFWNGHKSLDKFGENLIAFGNGIKEYCDTIGHIRDGSDKYSEIVVAMAKGLAEIDPQESGGIKSWFVGDDGLKNFGKNIKAFGEAMADYSKSISEIGNTINMQLIIAECNRLIDLVERINSAGGTDCLVDFAYNMEQFSSSVVETFQNEFSSTETQKNTVDSIVTFITYATQGIIDNKSMMVKAMSDAVEAMITSLTQNNHDRDAYESGKTIALNVYTAVVNTLLSMTSPYSMYSAGSAAVAGFVNGVYGRANSISLAGAFIGSTFALSTEKSLKIESPSKVMEKDGGFAVTGFVNGVTKTAAAAVAAVKDKGKEIVNSFFGGNASDVLTEDLNLNPVITPVLDDSLLQNGVADVNSMFDDKQVNVASNAFSSIPEAPTQTSIADMITRTIGSYFPSVIDAIDRVGESGQEIKLTLDPNTAKFYKEMRVENRRFYKNTGKNGMIV